MYHREFRSVYKLNAHIVFVVKYRRKAIDSQIMTRLKEIFSEILKKWNCTLVEFNGEKAKKNDSVMLVPRRELRVTLNYLLRQFISPLSFALSGSPLASFKIEKSVPLSALSVAGGEVAQYDPDIDQNLSSQID